MIYKEIYKNLFTMDEKYTLGQAISLDCEMGEGIAVEFNKQFKGMKRFLLNKIEKENLKFPVTILYDKDKQLVFNLITKKKYNGKPTYATIYYAIKQMKDLCIEHNIKYLALPKIGCGLDRLQWGEVREMIQQEFQDIDIEIIICRYK